MEKIKDTPFGELSFVGDLLSKSYPTTMIYKTDNHEPIIVEWLDEDDDGNDMFIIFQTSIDNLRLFYKGVISHIELIKSAEKNIYFDFIGSINDTQFNRVKFRNIDKTSLPKASVYFDSEHSEDFKLIAETFGIEFSNSEKNEKYFEELKKHSENVDTGLFRLHILEGGKIGHGTADTKALGQLLLGFENLYHEVALDVIRGVDRNPKVKNLPEEILISDMASTEVYIQEAASFSIYLKSKVDTALNVEQKDSVSDEIFTKIDNVISSTINKNDLNNITTQYSEEVFESLADFTKTIFENKIIVDLDYYNSNSNRELRQIMKPADAHTINNNITSYSRINESTVRFTGQFLMLNTKTGYFQFLSNERKEISGYVSSLIMDNMISFNFTSIYNVSVTQRVYETLDTKGRITYVLESCLKLDE